jgi:hypothetical protein
MDSSKNKYNWHIEHNNAYLTTEMVRRTR